MTSEFHVRLILWVAIASSMAVFYGLTFVIEPTEPGVNEVVAYVLAGLALAAVAGSFPLRASLGESRNGFIFAICLSESAALQGFIAHLLTGWSLSWALFLIGFTGMALHFPRKPN